MNCRSSPPYLLSSCRGRNRTGDLEVMGLASYHCSTLPFTSPYNRSRKTSSDFMPFQSAEPLALIGRRITGACTVRYFKMPVSPGCHDSETIWHPRAMSCD